MPFGVDIVCGCCLVIALYNGYQQGARKAGTQLLFLLVALLLAWFLRMPVGNLVILPAASDMPSVFAELIAFILLLPLLIGLMLGGQRWLAKNSKDSQRSREQRTAYHRCAVTNAPADFVATNPSMWSKHYFGLVA